MIKQVFLALAICLVMAVSASAQLHNHTSGLPHGVPDFCAHDPNSIMVPVGATQVFSGVQTSSCIGIHGTAIFDSTFNQKASTILVYSDGFLTIQNGAIVTFRDTPLDTVFDPEQFSNGLLGFGKVRINGNSITPFVRLSSDVPQSTTTLILQVPADWKVGHRLEVPDTRQLTGSDMVPGSFASTISRPIVDQSEVCTISEILPMGVTCAQPMKYVHLGAHSPAIATENFIAPPIDLFPHVANLTRGITFQSENPNGVRGHVFFSQRADVQIKGAAFVGLGRTTGAHIDDTTFDESGLVTHIGTNEKGRYTLHFHHVFGILNSPDPYQLQITDSVMESGEKWGISIHNTSWGLIQDNVCVGMSGGCYVTEDGNETNNVFNHNFGASVVNNKFDLKMNTYDPEGNRQTIFWFRGINQRVTNNVAYASRSGFAWYTGNDENPPLWTAQQQRVPRFRGADTTIDANVTYDVSTQSVRLPMLAIENNEAAGMNAFCMEFWWTQGAVKGLKPSYLATGRPPNTSVKNSTCWHFGGVDTTGTFQGAGISIHYTDMTFDGIKIVNESGKGLALVGVNDGGGIGLGFGSSEYNNADVRGVDTIWQHGGQIALPVYWGFKNSFFQSIKGVSYYNAGESGAGLPDFDAFGHMLLTSVIEFDNVKFASMPGFPLKSIQPVFIRDTARGYEGTRRIRVNVRAYQGVVGDDFRVYMTGQAPNEPAPLFFPVAPGTGQTRDLGCPEVLTNAECWAKFHMATLMQLAPVNTTTRPEISGLIGPPVVDPPDANPAPPPPVGQPPVVPFSCPECVTSVTFESVMWTLGPETTPPGNDRVVMRNGVPHADSKAIAYLVFSGKLYVYNKSVGFWFEWVPKALAFRSVTDPRLIAPPVNCVFVWSDWSNWIPVVPATNPPTESRTRFPSVTVLPSNGGMACPAPQVETRDIFIPPVPVDCVVSDFVPTSPWIPVVPATVPPTEYRELTRTVLMSAANGGLACPNLTSIETRNIIIPPPPPICQEYTLQQFTDKISTILRVCQ